MTFKRPLAALALAAALLSPAFAADMATKARIATGYPTACGLYYGIGTGGSAGRVEGGNVGERIVQGELDAMIGYTCPFAGNAFWFAEAQIGVNNLNGSRDGFTLDGPLVAMQRVGVGSPLNTIMGAGLFGNLNLSMPSIPVLPAGITASPGNGYLFAGLVEQDISAQIGVAQGHQWVVAFMPGVGVLTRASNGVMIDTWAGWQMNSNAFCPGGGNVCARLGNAVRVGASLKY